MTPTSGDGDVDGRHITDAAVIVDERPLPPRQLTLASTPPLPARLSQFIRPQQGEVQQPSVATVSERLQRARIDHLRHRRNVEDEQLRKQRRQQDHAVPSGSTQAVSSTAARPKTSSALPPLASGSNPGLAFLSHTSLNQQERDQRLRNRQIQRRIAGPIPPQSWRQDDNSNSGQGPDNEDATLRSRSSHAQIEARIETRKRAVLARRHRVCSALRALLDERDEATSQVRLAQRLPTLRNMALCAIAALAIPTSNQGSKAQRRYRAELFDLSIDHIPPHLRRTMATLCGRQARVLGATAETLLSLLRPTHARTGAVLKSTASLRPDSASANEAGSDDDDDDDGADWDAEDDEPVAQLVAQKPKSTPESSRWTANLVDLSYYDLLGPAQVRSVLNSNLVVANSHVNLRALSLAGFRLDFADPDALLRILAKLANLELLSLAGSSGSSSSALDHGMFLKRLSRATPRLQVLDLSYCAWVDSQAVCCVSWSEWPRLDHLVLKGCEPLQHPVVVSCEREDLDAPPELPDASVGDGRGVAAANFVAPWHALHHGQGRRDGQASTVRSSVLVATRPGILPGTGATSQSAAASDGGRHEDAVRALTRQASASWTAGRVRGSGHTKAVSYTQSFVRCPTSGKEVEQWQWERAMVLDAVRGRLKGGGRRWVEVWF
ncbi:uncharacterized protein PFL1_02500 [Pseudozyma flocculosa PF-1]|uniref:Uncharacterized protein n=2 Tax=Pseudozyma flocculosa TaxID=84751 RepID=A0A5C3EZ60_9BASI|nr:uncharacterized protein PFL1_02500 [Pseudozyma flocculosa PF-1]EPQ29827.1 hypothetical protein PFL1_02500 [Pseudozyma flocculosa PF-1]SPO37120.1 uncharacterized protein PSFLO_02592 [Pseudozyma flocculosa]